MITWLRYSVGHKGKFGHEFLEFEFKGDGQLRYANNSNYKRDTMIRKEGGSPEFICGCHVCGVFGVARLRGCARTFG